MSTPMIFSEEEAFEQLDEEGIVYTVRDEKKELGDVWIRKSRTGPKEFDAERFIRIELQGSNPAHEITLDTFKDYSGFETLDDWKNAIKGDTKWLYGVKKEGEETPIDIQDMEEILSES